MSEHEGRFFGSREELENDVLRYNARLDYMILLDAIKPHQRMVFEGLSGQDKITWHLIEKYEDVWQVAGYEFSTVALDVSLALHLDPSQDEFKRTIQYIMSRVRRPGRHK
ncbi:hypothetical protein QGX21_gp002 [Pseudomonas phage phiPsa315]|uniref:Uncharacterized protein n=1 Tax=Pseudomonas phage phiPsa315 TaxID=1460363 RepID=A0A7G9V1Z1_9CAUD|nr:hypothetical protein QGX21_gp002 [Pseudomonas phage phiPsa315]QNO00297.1 hypothetical protein phiPsa315_002 [Pseudomonas phage phiPsa315]